MRIGCGRVLMLLCLLARTGSGALVADRWEHLRTTTTEEYRVTYWKSEQGLPQNTVNCVLQCRNGYIWVGTQYGMARFDGCRFVDFTDQLSQVSGEDVEVKAMAEDADGVLWLHNGKALLSYRDGAIHQSALTNSPPARRLQALIADPKQGVWLSSGATVFNVHRGKVLIRRDLALELGEPVTEPNTSIRRLKVDRAERLWASFACIDGHERWFRFDDATSGRWTIPGLLDREEKKVCGLVPGVGDEVWLARPGELLHWSQGKLERLEVSVPWGRYNVKTMTSDHEGALWIVSEGSIQLHRFKAGQFLSFGKADGLPGADDVRCVYPDREGNLWIGTGSGGLCRLQPRRMVSLLAGSQSTLDEVYSIARGDEGRTWLATTYGVVKYQEGQFTVFTNTAAFGDGNIKRVRLVFERRSGEVLSTLDFLGLHILRGDSFQPCDYMPEIHNERRPITSLAESGDGTLWIASSAGLGERRGDTTRLWTTQHGLSDNRTFGLVIGRDGGIWVGTHAGGVNYFKDNRFRSYATREGLLNNNAWPLREESDGSLWVGTPSGLNRIRDGQVRSVTMRHGLFDSLAYCLLEDRQGNYWTFGNRGIWRMKKQDLNAVADGRQARVHCVSYGEADGMPSVEGNGDQQPNALALPGGQLWFPMTRGVVVVDPPRLRENVVPPVVLIEQVRVDTDEVYRDGGYSLPNRYSRDTATGLKLPPGRARVMEVSFTANTFIDADKTVFRCRLLGDHSEWRDLGTRRTAVFTNLRPGQYRFQVEACNHHGYWSEHPAEFAFALAPHFYQTWLFQCSVTAFAAAGFGVWYTRRLRLRRRMQALSRDRAVESERNRIARDLHDDLGANLTGLAVRLDLAVRQSSHDAELGGQLTDLSRSARGLADAMREIVWAINPRCDTLESFCAYVCGYAEKFTRSVGLSCRFDLPPAFPEVALTSEMRHHLLLAIKEALNNAARHASATEVMLSLRWEEGQLLVEVSDNGRGCPAEAIQRVTAPIDEETGPESQRRRGNGLLNMRQRMALIGGHLEMQGVPGAGTRVRFRANVLQTGSN